MSTTRQGTLQPSSESALAGPGAGLEFLYVSEEDCRRWDLEWLKYFLALSYSGVYLLDYTEMPVPNLERMSREEIWNALRIWAEGPMLINRRILEIGCGTGYLGKQLGRVVRFYFGLDYSRLALHMARLVSPRNCEYACMQEKESIARHVESMDTMVGREFFIHQNWNNAMKVLKLAHYLLRPGGFVCADFYLRDLRVPQGRVHPAKHHLDLRHPSCTYFFSKAEVFDLASACGFEVVDMVDRVTNQRRLVTLRKCANGGTHRDLESIRQIRERRPHRDDVTTRAMLLLLVAILLLFRRTEDVRRIITRRSAREVRAIPDRRSIDWLCRQESGHSVVDLSVTHGT
jgi:SAM-dependent methyltransferase